MREKKREFGW